MRDPFYEDPNRFLERNRKMTLESLKNAVDRLMIDLAYSYQDRLSRVPDKEWDAIESRIKEMCAEIENLTERKRPY